MKISVSKTVYVMEVERLKETKMNSFACGLCVAHSRVPDELPARG